MSKTQHKTGKVILAAAGPGDPELITVKALRYLKQADVVLTDRLVSDVILEEYVNEAAEIIYVGKQCRRGNSTLQLNINDLMVELAQQGKLVVRLKGGDVSVFSNILDEIIALKNAGIAYEIIPGVTAALGAAAYAGIPLTARGYSTGIRLLTFYRSDVIKKGYWKELAQTDDTLVFYMSAETLDELVSRLLENGIDEEKMLAVIEQATTPLQTVRTMKLNAFASEKHEMTVLSPTLVIIGRVVSLHDEFRWIENSNSNQHYFDTGKSPLESIVKSGLPFPGSSIIK